MQKVEGWREGTASVPFFEERAWDHKLEKGRVGMGYGDGKEEGRCGEERGEGK